jgi:hypothetical protein
VNLQPTDPGTNPTALHALCGILIVERTRTDGHADVVYTYVTPTKSGEYRLSAEVDADSLQFTDPEGGRFVFYLTGNTLNSRFISAKNFGLSTIFKRQ